MNKVPRAPLFRDPIYDGAADPTVIWNPSEKQWWMFYTNRRASSIGYRLSCYHGTDIGIASSADGVSWIYRGTACGLEFERGHNTFWAPEVLYAQGQYHMYCSYVRGVPSEWGSESNIVHYTSTNLWDWRYESVLALSSTGVIDACVYEIAPNCWKMWYKDGVNGSHTYSALSSDLYHWQLLGPEITDCPHEGPNVFVLGGQIWMITDPWDGLGVYQSQDYTHWQRCNNILAQPGTRPEDGSIANHGDVVVFKDRAYVFYFTHPEMSREERMREDFVQELRHRRTSIQVAELVLEDDHLVCDRNYVQVDLGDC